ncbi:trypsin-like serine protease [Streptomyces sp. CA-243310]|uniref:trypsin-like serine protease n=1 Tax=Streptomyces sp. CA-243310 TaxID=3240056 RepID=UPI003D946F90
MAVTGPEAAAGQSASVVKLTVGDEANSRGCTAALVDESWIATAGSCFATTPGQQVPAGKPALKSTVTLTGGKVVEVVDLVPRTDRDLVLARLAEPVKGVTSVKRAAVAPAPGSVLTAVGFGRTKTEWVPNKPHTGSFTVDSAAATSLTITGKGTDAMCKGDTGGPLLNAAGELVGVNSRSWQGGCLGIAATETRTGALSSRTDNLGDWIQETILRSIAQRDLNGDGRADAVMVYHHADTSISFYSSLTTTTGAFEDFTEGYKVPVKSWDRASMKLISGDFNGDRRTDMGMMYRFADGSIKMYTGLADPAGHIQPFTSSYTVPASAGWDWNAIQLQSGDLNGDGRADAVMVYHHADTSISFYSSLTTTTGAFEDFTEGYKVPVKSWDRASMKLISGDFNGDRRTDMGMMYRFADGSIKMYTGLADPAGHIQPFTSSYTVPASAGWDWNAIQLQSGDLNGDGRADAVMVYHHADTSISFYSSLTTTTGAFEDFTEGYKVPVKSWDRASMKLISGDFNGDRRTDMGMMYRFADGSIKMYTGLADPAGHIQPFTSSYTVPASAGWDWNAIQLP